MTASLFPGLAVPRSTKEQYRRRAQAIILRRAFRGEEVTADHVHELLPCPDGVDANNLGLAFSALADIGLIAPVRFERSTRAARHSGIHRSWRIADAKAARAYLKALASTGDDHVAT